MSATETSLLPGAPGPGADRPPIGEEAIELSAARLGSVPVPVDTLWDPATCPAHLLPWLAWALSVDQWRSDWTVAAKRNRIATAIEAHRRKGTVWAVRDALSPYGDVTIQELGSRWVFDGSLSYDGEAVYSGGDFAPVYFDGSQRYDGGTLYAGDAQAWAWAYFSILLDIDILQGEGLGADAEAALRELVDLARPVSRHLRYLAYRGTLAEAALAPEQTWQATSSHKLHDSTHTYGGTITHRTIAASYTHRFDGGLTYNLSGRYGAARLT